MGKAPNFSSFRERHEFLWNLQGVDCVRLKIIHRLKWHILEKPGLNPSRSNMNTLWIKIIFQRLKLILIKH